MTRVFPRKILAAYDPLLAIAISAFDVKASQRFLQAESGWLNRSKTSSQLTSLWLAAAVISYHHLLFFVPQVAIEPRSGEIYHFSVGVAAEAAFIEVAGADDNFDAGPAVTGDFERAVHIEGMVDES